ncbi:MAG: hypothetical protein JO146_02575 [Candidatus Eremiobacteraeota bacterium]|nr:hypothetical protein [Candidatus Eremiobacteraeota bacterium]
MNRFLASVAASFLIAGIGVSSATAVSGASSRIQPAKSKVTCNKTSACFDAVNSGTGSGLEGDDQYGGSAAGYGVVGTSLDGIGVYGAGENNGGVEGFSIDGFGVQGGSSSGNGVAGIASSGNGLYGQTASGYGVYGTASAGFPGAFISTGTDTDSALVALADSPYSFPFYAVNEVDGGYFYVDVSGDGYFSGGVYTQQSPMVEQRARDGGSTGTFTAQSTRATLEDTGTARMTDGEAAVRFDPAYARLLDFSHGYQVFLTPDGDTRGLYVAQKFEGGFMVREIERGRSSLYFDYRVVGHPYGATAQRLPHLAFRPPALPKLLRPLSKPSR